MKKSLVKSPTVILHLRRCRLRVKQQLVAVAAAYGINQEEAADIVMRAGLKVVMAKIVEDEKEKAGES